MLTRCFGPCIGLLIAAGVLGGQQSPPLSETSSPETDRVADQQPAASKSPGPPTLEIQNRYGAIRVRVEDVNRPKVEVIIEGRAVTPSDLALDQAGGSFQVLATPPDGAHVQLNIIAPYGLLVEAATTDGRIEFSGYGRANLQTNSGAVALTFPANATSFDLVASEPPNAFQGDARIDRSSDVWTARDRLSDPAAAYGRITLRAKKPRSVTLIGMDGIPEDSPIKPHWQAEELLPRIFRRFGEAKLVERDAATPDSPGGASSADFSIDARLVQIDVSVMDKEGSPVTGLGPKDFEVIEGGEAQTVTAVSGGDDPFNLVLLLDCSSSTERDRQAIEQAAGNFIDVARTGDKVAVYVLAETHFQALSKLTADFSAARSSIQGIGPFGGATPLYDATILAYAEELSGLPRERNALVILSDGLDNGIYETETAALVKQVGTQTRFSAGVPSTVNFGQLKKAAQEMRALIYPIVLDPVAAIALSQPFLLERARGWGVTVRQQAKSLAAATGGRVFSANSIDDLDEVYEQVAEELRSVYTVTYRPKNQEFDGRWRQVKVKTSERSAAVRGRRGYYAY